MPTNIVLTRGSDWGTNRIYDPSVWGHDVTNEQAESLAQLCLELFQELATKTSAYWQPQISEVIGHIGDAVTSDQLEAWREQAIDCVWSAVIGESNDPTLTNQVNALFPDELP